MKLFLSRAMAVTLLLTGALLLMVSITQVDWRSRADRITDACKREFGDHDKGAVLECTVTVLNEWASDLEHEKISRVYQSTY